MIAATAAVPAWAQHHHSARPDQPISVNHLSNGVRRHGLDRPYRGKVLAVRDVSESFLA